MKYDLIVSDYDGTLGSNEGIDEGTVEAIKKFESKGGIFCICTGRPFYSIRVFCKKYGFNGLVASCQGSDVRKMSGEFLVNDGIDYKWASILSERTLKDGFEPAAFIGDALYYQNKSGYAERYWKLEVIPVKKVKSMSKYFLRTKKTAFKLAFICDHDKIAEWAERYSKEYPEFSYNNGGGDIFEIINPKYSKGNAVRTLSKYYGIPYEKIMCVGDSTNDYELLNGPWHGVAVKNGVGEKKLMEVAKEVGVPYEEHPVKQLIEKYCL